MVVNVDADMVIRNIVLVDGARLAGGEYERQPGSYGWRSCHLLPRPPNLPSFGNHRHHHQLIKITIVIAIIAIIIKNATISVIKKECKRNGIIQVVGVRTQQRLLLLPWQLYHATLILACVGGGFYQVGLVFGVVTL